MCNSSLVVNKTLKMLLISTGEIIVINIKEIKILGTNA